jgi:hypothetical protein
MEAGSSQKRFVVKTRHIQPVHQHMVTPTRALRAATAQPTRTLPALLADVVGFADVVADLLALALETAWVADVVVRGVVLTVAETMPVEVAVGVSGAVDWPLIWAWTAAEKAPVMLARVNLAENARAGNWGCTESLRDRDSKRMKYWLLLGPMVGSGVNERVDTCETSVLLLRDWRRVCC